MLLFDLVLPNSIITLIHDDFKIIVLFFNIIFIRVFSDFRLCVYTLLILYFIFCNQYNLHERTAVAQWLRLCATNRKVAGSIPGVVIGIFH